MTEEKSEVFQSPGKKMKLKREQSEGPECMGGAGWRMYVLSLLFAILNIVH